MATDLDRFQENPKVIDAFAKVGLTLARFRDMDDDATIAAMATSWGTERLTFGHLRKLQASAFDAGDRLQRIASWHSRETAEGGMVGDFCVECGNRWPCETRRMADGTHEDLAAESGSVPFESAPVAEEAADDHS